MGIRVACIHVLDMLDITPPAGNHFYDFLYLIRTDILECDGFLEAIAQATLPGRMAPGHNATLLQRRISEIRQYLLIAQLTIRCTTDSTVYGVTTPPDEDGAAVISLNKDLIEEWLITCRDDLYSTYLKQHKNFYLLQVAIYITVVHEYMHLIMYRFSAPDDRGFEVIRGKAVEAGYWVEGWLSQHGRAYFLYEAKRAHIFSQMCAIHFVDQSDGSFIELKRDELDILKTLAAGKWRPLSKDLHSHRRSGNDWPRANWRGSERSRGTIARPGQTSSGNEDGS